MADKNLEIGVKITSDTSGAQKAAAEIKKLAEEASKKPFEMPIDEAGMKAREEAMRLQIEAAKKEAQEVAKAAEATKVHAKAAQQDTEAVKVEAKAIEQVAVAAKKKVEVTAMSTTTANGAAQAQRQLTDKTTQSAMGFLQLSQAVEDAQYGVRGILNNIPGMVMSFGGGAGLAGAVSLAAVGISALVEHVDIFGEKAKKAKQDAADLSQEMMAKADAAYLDARATEAATKAQQAYNDTLQEAEGHYKAVLAQAQAVTSQKREMADAEIAAADAEAALQMAQLQLAEARGQVSKEDAILAREKIRTEAEARKFTAESAAAEAAIAEQRKKAAAEDELARRKKVAAMDLEAKGAGLLKKEEKEALEARIAATKAEMERSRILQTEMAKGGANAVGLKPEQARFSQMQARLLEDEAKIAENKRRANETGVSTQEALNDEVKKQVEEARKATDNAKQARQAAESGEFGRRSRAAVFQTRQAASATSAQAQVEAERARREEEAAKERDRITKTMEREREQVGTAGGRVVSALAGSGATAEFQQQLQAAISQTAAGGSMETLMALMQKLMSNLGRLDASTQEKIQKLQAEINDLSIAK